MNYKKYEFDAEKAYNAIRSDWKDFMSGIGTDKVVVGISGGKDSTVVAYLAASVFGSKNVYGVMMPCDGQKDIDDSKEVIRLTGINSVTIDIGDAYRSILDSVENNSIEVSEDSRINTAPRIRMSALYAVAQSVGGIVANTSNLTEDVLGYATLWGDSVGSYAPIQHLTVTEVIRLGEWFMVPDCLIRKVPADGL